MNNSITAMVFTFNEERRLPFIYQNFKNFCEIIVFDGGSTDGTESYCKENNIKFIRRPANTSLHTQENRQTEGMWPDILKFAYIHCPSEYVLHVLCSHFYPARLLNEFNRVARENRKEAVFCDLVSLRYGAIVHQAFLRRVPSVCVFYKKSIVDFEKTRIHDELAIEYDDMSMIRLKASNETSLHLFQDETYFIATNKNLKYAEIDARQRFARGEECGLLRGVLRALRIFLYSYIRLGSFRFGTRGLAYAIVNFQYELSIALMKWELGSALSDDAPVQKNADKRNELLKQNFGQ
jgi:glycosyltransferase involved in cell wall biosynthesis